MGKWEKLSLNVSSLVYLANTSNTLFMTEYSLYFRFQKIKILCLRTVMNMLHRFVAHYYYCTIQPANPEKLNIRFYTLKHVSLDLGFGVNLF